ncbi:DNA-3-methyladenine glycosylase II [hydrothermal vent metagenome]|uniref:DNA-3-methyladenine glycosylase II n=1 Tax=hydrothermal vent metagenome TaxID=652676 RepID=A0A3B0T802_9ZZZZ
MTRSPQNLNTEADLDAAIAVLVAADKRLAAVARVTGRPPLRRRADGFAGLAAIIISQQVSIASAQAIHRRVSSALGDISARTALKAGEAGLRACGLSGPKIRTFLAVATAEASGQIDFGALRAQGDRNVTEHLVALKGIGPWTAEIYLLSCLGRADVWPAGDLALREAMKLALDLDIRPRAEDTHAHAEPWRPYRSVAARLLWSYYAAARNLGRETGGSL